MLHKIETKQSALHVSLGRHAAASYPEEIKREWLAMLAAEKNYPFISQALAPLTFCRHKYID